VAVSPLISSDRSGASWATLEAALDKSLPILSAIEVGRHPGVFDKPANIRAAASVFGQPIGRFQRVQDHCVDISINLDMARWATYRKAIWRIDSAWTPAP